ncbi:MAG: hypothetical protein J7L14_01060 [Candidatus Diapherotrites archaeon]|nr:hypothetical protein [Candidatus Diapherotrites archaeon]
MHLEKKIVFIIATLMLLQTAVPFAFASTSNSKYICAVYFTGIGCPHCAKTDPVLLEQLLEKYPNLIIIEYEIYQQNAANAPVFMEYGKQYNTELGVPLIIFGKDDYIIGDTPILTAIEDKLSELKYNPCPLIDGSNAAFESLNLNDLKGEPKIWHRDRILIKKATGESNSDELKKLILGEISLKSDGSIDVPLSGMEIKFANSKAIDSWILGWKSSKLTNAKSTNIDSNNIKPQQGLNGGFTNNLHHAEQNMQSNNIVLNTAKSQNTQREKLSLALILGLAAVDAINPCALAVLTLMLLAIITYNPKDRRKVLFAGFAFTLAVYIGYLFYGLILIKFFQFVRLVTSIRLLLYQLLGVIAIILAILNIKDFFFYKPGGIMTEMPLSWRPKLKKIINKVTSVKAAAAVGIFVTLFLLPCTIGPYVITAGILSAVELIKTIPWLLLYNFIFVSPMLAITLIVYYGFGKVEDISGWKDKNIRRLHLTAGLIMLGIGLAMLFGFV